MTALRIPLLRASPHTLLRSGLKWLRRPGETVAARDPLAVCSVRLGGDEQRTGVLAEEQNDLQVVLGAPCAGEVSFASAFSKGGYQDLVGSDAWDEGEVIGAISGSAATAELLPLVLAGRRGFENGEGRGGLLAGWHERARASWEGAGSERFGTVLSLGTCEQTSIFRGEDMAFLSWFARAPGPAQIVWVSDERTVHSSAVLLQHLRRTQAEAAAIVEAVRAFVDERLRVAGFPAFEPQAAGGILRGRWPEAQEILFAFYLLAEAAGTSPILERTQILTRRGVVEQRPPDAIALSLGSDFAPHFRHRKTGWTIALHGFRFGQFIGPAVVEWLRRDFERIPRRVDDVERDLAALADEVAARTGGALVVQNVIASSTTDRISNYSWIGDTFAESLPVMTAEANLMLTGLTRRPAISMIDSDALAADLGVRHCPDRFHASRELLEAQRKEFHRVLRERSVPGF